MGFVGCLASFYELVCAESSDKRLSLLVPHLSRVAEEKGLTDKVTATRPLTGVKSPRAPSCCSTVYLESARTFAELRSAVDWMGLGRGLGFGAMPQAEEILLFASQQLIDAGSPEPATAKLEQPACNEATRLQGEAQ